MAIIRQYHKDTDTTYVYESESYWDEEKKQSRSKRRLIGKVDPVTGEIIPTGKRGRKGKEKAKTTSSADLAAAEKKIGELSLELNSCKARVTDLSAENQRLRELISQMEKHITRCAVLCAEATPGR